jgi:hypothetical protein
MKATNSQIEQRVSEVLRLRVAGAEFDDIRQYASVADKSTGRPWGVSDRQLWRYVALSDKALLAAVEKKRDMLLARHLAQRRLLYAKALESGDWRGALAALKDEADLERLYDPPPTDAPAMPLANAADVVTARAQAVNEVRSGQLDARTAGTITQMIATQIRAIEAGNLAARIEMLEMVLKQRNGDGKP